MSSVMRLSVYQLLSVIIGVVLGQDDFGGGEDAGGSDMDLESMMGGTGGGAKTTNNPNFKPKIVEKSLFEESVSAMQQLGFIIGEQKNC